MPIFTLFLVVTEQLPYFNLLYLTLPPSCLPFQILHQLTARAIIQDWNDGQLAAERLEHEVTRPNKCHYIHFISHRLVDMFECMHPDTFHLVVHTMWHRN